MSDPDLDRMKATAREATPGPWTVDGPLWNQIVWAEASGYRVAFLAHSAGRDVARDAATGQFFATFDPPTVTALIERLEKAEAENAADRDTMIEIRELLATSGVPVAAFIDDNVRNALAQRDKARADLAEAVEALEPFACDFGHLPDGRADWEPQNIDPDPFPSVTAAHERAARIVAKHKEPEHD